MIEFYDRNGKRMSLMEWSKAFENPKYRVLASHNVGNLLVSTVWLGFDHDFMNLIRETPLPPQIFESMIFEVPDGGPVDWSSLEMRRYRTEKDAMIGHTELVHLANTMVDIENGVVTEVATDMFGLPANEWREVMDDGVEPGQSGVPGNPRHGDADDSAGMGGG